MEHIEKTLSDQVIQDFPDRNNDTCQFGTWFMEFNTEGALTTCCWSQGFRELLGFLGAEDFPDKLESWSNRLHPEDKQAAMETYWNAVAGVGDCDMQYRLLTKGGDYHWYRQTGQTVRREDGSLRIFTGVLIDITVYLENEKQPLEESMDRTFMQQNLKKEQEYIAQERERFNIISSLVSVYFCTYYIDLKRDTYKEITSLDYLQEYLPNQGSATQGFHLWVETAILEEWKEEMTAFLELDTLSERMGNRNSITIDYKTKRMGWCQGSFTVVDRDWSGKLWHVLWSSREINEEKEREEQSRRALEDAFKAANRANAAKTDFLSNMSHDIRTPMNAIIGMTAIAGTHLEDRERVMDCLGKITVASRHLLALINEVLDMSKIESGKIDLVEEEFSLPDLIDNLMTMTRSQVEAKQHDLKVTVHDVEHEEVIGDSLRIQQVFTNLLTNAIKYTPDGGKLHIFITEKPSNISHLGCYEFIFEDNGIGMSEEFLPHLFEPFARAGEGYGAQQQGTGLGMSITRNIVRMMNGDIQVQSKLGEGTRFVVTIFFKLKDVKQRSQKEFLDLNVLVADDDQIACETTCIILDELGMNSEGVLSGREALHKVQMRHAEKNDYFAVILDWKMPDMDGLAATRAIRREVGEDVPIIIISSYDWSDIEAEARTAGANAFVSKPLFKSRVVHLFEELLGNQEEEEVKTLTDTIGKENFSGRRALLAEDNDLNVEIATEILKMVGLEVECARDGREVVDMMAASEVGYYDVIFMDIQMPFMNGNDAARAIRALPNADARTIPIFAMTANAFVSDIQASFGAGMNEHIAKPLDINQLLRVLNKWLCR